MKRHGLILGAIALVLSLSLSSGAYALEAPAMAGPVNDLAGVLDQSENAELTQYLQAVNDQTGVQVAVLTVPSLEGEAIENFSMRVAEKWKLGQADKDNGALLVVSIQDRSLRIETGYGLEGELTDAKCGLIIRNVIVPLFKQGEYGKGISEGAKNIVGIATGDASIVASNVREGKAESNSGAGGGFVGIVFLIFFIIIMSAARGRNRRHGGGLGGFLGPFILGSMLGSSGRRHGSGWDNHSGGGFGGFGGGGGGFSGGGGGFGGGGASGGW